MITSSWPWWPGRTLSDAWDATVRWHMVRLEAPNMDLDPLTVESVRDDHLRAPNGTAEDAYIARLIRVSLGMAERRTRRLLITQRWAQVMDSVVSRVVIQRSPVQSVESVTYIDAEGIEQTWGASPPPYTLVNGSMDTNAPAELLLSYGESLPSPRSQRDAVSVNLVLGFPTVGEDPAVADIPEEINQGRLLVIGELYKQRSVSVHAFNQNPAIITANALWDGWRMY